jgi:hypothetical protein
VVERSIALGGAGINTGTIPSKTRLRLDDGNTRVETAALQKRFRPRLMAEKNSLDFQPEDFDLSTRGARKKTTAVILEQSNRSKPFLVIVKLTMQTIECMDLGLNRSPLASVARRQRPPLLSYRVLPRNPAPIATTRFQLFLLICE